MPEHGQERNRRIETDTSYSTWHTPQGDVILPTSSVTQTVSERYCEPCGQWRTTKGIMGALLCVECGHPWDKFYWEDKDA